MSRPFSLLIATKPVWVTNPTLDVALKGSALTRILSAHDAVSYALHSGTLPDGVTVSSSGELSGTPTEDGSFVFTVRATGESANASTDRTFTILVAAQPAWVSPQELPALPVATSVTYQLVADGGTSFSLQSGAVPGGLTLSPLGLLSGTPGLAGSYAFVVRAVSTHPDFVTDRSFTLQVNASPVWVTSAALADVATGTAISLQFEASLSPTYSVLTGALPVGTTLSAQGVLSGTPTDPGVYTFSVRASNAPGYGSNRTFTILVVATPVWVTASPLVDVFVSAPLSVQFVATGATGFSLVGTLPAGVTLASNGLLSGTPTATGTTNFQVRALTASASVSAIKAFVILVTKQPVFTTATALPNSFRTANAATIISATDAVSYELASGALPTGTTLTTAGILTGTFTQPGSFAFGVKANGTSPIAFANKSFTQLVVTPPVWQTAPGLTELLRDRPATFQLDATYASEYSLEYGVVPGLSVSTSGLLSGTPTVAGTTPLTIRAKTPNPGVYTDREFSALVELTPVWATTSVTTVAQGFAYTFTFVTDTAINYTLKSGSFPTGLTLSSAGVLSGTTTDVGSYSFEIRAAKVSPTNYTDKAFTLVVTDVPVWATAAALTDVASTLAYSVTLSASNTDLYTVTTGALPTGLTLTGATGVIAGTPSANGTFNFTVRAHRTGTTTVFTDRAFTQVVAPKPVWSTAAGLANTAQNAAYSLSLVATNTASYAVTAGTLPPGVTLASNGALSGTPSAVGTYVFTVTATSTGSSIITTDRAFTLQTVPLPVWTTTTLLDIPTNVGISVQLAATNAVSFALKTGALPTGLTLSSGGLLSGTPTVAGSSSFTITATGAATNAVTDQALTQLVATTPTWTTPASLANTAQSVAYSFALVATNASTTGFSVTAGALPAGVSLSSSGILSGTPSAAATYNFTVRAASATSTAVFADRSFSLTTVPLPVWTSPSAGALTDLPEGSAIATINFVATNSLSYAVTTGTLPTGLSLSSAGALTGTPSAGSYSFTVTATGNATNATAAQAFTQIVATTPTWTTAASLSNTAQSVAYSFTLLASNASATGFSVTTGTLPAGLSLSTAGVLSGTPSAAATYNFTVRALSTTSSVVFADRAFTLTTVPLPVWTTTTLTDVASGSVYSVQLAATNAVSFALKTGTLPTGLSLSAGGLLSGTPSAAGSFSFTITATGAAVNAATDQALTQIVATTPTWTTSASLSNTAQDVAYSFALVATNALATGYSLLSGALPAGVTLGADGTLSGTPTASTTYNFTVRVRSVLSAIVFADRSFSLTTVPLPVWSSPAAGALADLPTGSAITTINFVATNGVTYAVQTGALPTGLALSTNGQLTGTPTAAGSFSFTVRATGNATNATADRAFTQLVAAVPVWTTSASLTDIAATTAVSFQFAASNAVSYALTAGSLPPGLSLSAGGLLSGTADATIATYNFTIRATGASAIAFADLAFTQNIVANITLNYVRYRGLVKTFQTVTSSFISSTGDVYGCGTNEYGQLTGAAGSVTNLMTKTPIITGITDVVCCAFHMFAKAASGQWYTWGTFAANSLGTGSTTAGITSPVAWNGLSNVTTIVANGHQAGCFFAKTASGSWYFWGQQSLELGYFLGTGNNNNYPTPTLFTALSGVKSITGIYRGFLILLESSDLYGVGSMHNSGPAAYQVPTFVMSGVQKVFSGQHVSTIVKKLDGTIWGWGFNYTGGLGLGHTNVVSVLSPQRLNAIEALDPLDVYASTSFTAVLQKNGTVVFFGDKATFMNSTGNALTGITPAGMPINVIAIMGGNDTHMALVTSGLEIYTSGKNASWRCGFNTGDPRDPTLLTTTFALAPVAVTPTWNTPAAFEYRLGAKRLDASDAGTYYVQAGALPAGLSLSTDGLITGSLLADVTTPAVFTVRAYGATTAAFADRAFSLTGGAAGIKKIVSGFEYSLILTTDGFVYSVGTSTVALGNGGVTSYSVPTKITVLSSIVDIACSRDDTAAALTSSGVVWCWGSNGQYTSTGTNQPHPGAANVLTPIVNAFLPGGVTSLWGGGRHIWAIAGGNVWGWGEQDFITLTGRMAVPKQVPGLTDIVKVTGGILEFAAITSTGVSYTMTWGNSPVLLSMGVADIFRANGGVTQLMTNGDVFMHGGITSYTTPTKIVEASGKGVVSVHGANGSGNTVVMLTDAGAVYYAANTLSSWITVTTLGLFVPLSLTVPFTKFYTSNGTTTALFAQGSDGRVYTVGQDCWSATASSTAYATPTAIPIFTNLLQRAAVNPTAQLRTVSATQSSTSFFVSTDGLVFGCGIGGNVLTGPGQTTSAANTLTQIQTLANIVGFAEGNNEGRPMWAKDALGRWWYWGVYSGNSGLGPGETSTAPVLWTALSADRIINGVFFNWAKTTDGQWYRWGGNGSGNLATGDTGLRGTPVLFTDLQNTKDVYLGGSLTERQCTLFLTTDNALYGAGDYGKVSINSTITTPTLISSNIAVVYTGSSQTMAIVRSTDGSIWCWGANTNGVLGLGNSTAVYPDAMVRHTALEALNPRNIYIHMDTALVLTAAGTVYGMGQRTRYKNVAGYDTAPTLVTGLSNIVSIDISHHSIFVDASNNIYTSGGNASYQTGFNTGTTRDVTLLPTTFTLQRSAVDTPPMWSTSPDLSGSALNVAYSEPLVATFGYSYALQSGALPTGLTLSSAGVLSGTPTAAGNYSFTVRAFGGSTAAYADRAFVMDLLASQAPDATFEALKLAGRLPIAAGVMNVAAYSLMPTAGEYDLVATDATSGTTAVTSFAFSLWTGGTGAGGSYASFVATPTGVTRDGTALTATATSGSTTVAANATYYARMLVRTNALTVQVYSGFTTGTWTLTGQTSSRTYAIAADMGDASMENVSVTSPGLTAVHCENTPVAAATTYPASARGGRSKNFYVTASGDVYGSGFNTDGSLTGSVGAASNLLTKIPILTRIVRLYDGIAFGLHFAMDSSGVWWQWGAFSAHELGNGSTSSGVLAPAPFTALSSPAEFVLTGGNGVFCKTTNGEWYVWGSNSTGVLGTGTTTAVSTPLKFSALTDINDITGHESGYALILLNDGRLYGVGSLTGGSVSTPVLMLTSVFKIFAGSFAQKFDGTWWAFGPNNGALGLGTTADVPATAPVSHAFLNGVRVKMITGYLGSTVLLLTNGVAYGAGDSGAWSTSTGTIVTSFAAIPNLPALPLGVATYDGNNMASTYRTFSGALYAAGRNHLSQGGFAATPYAAPTLVNLAFALAPLSRAPIWNTSSTILNAASGGLQRVRLDATDARLYEVVAGSLPAGLTLSTDGLITGTAGAAGAFAFTVRAYGLTSGAFAHRTFAWTVDAQALDAEFEALKTAGRIAKVANAYNLGAYSFLPTSGSYDFVVTDRSTTTTPGAAFAFSLFTGGTSASGAFSTYAVGPTGATRDAVAMTAASTSGTAAVTANTDYYARLRIDATQVTYSLHPSFTPGTWTFGAPLMTQTLPINAADVSMENMVVSTSGVGTLQNIYAVNTPIVAAQSYIRSVQNGTGYTYYLTNTGSVVYSGYNTDGRSSGVVGNQNNSLATISGLSNITHFMQGCVLNYCFAKDSNGVWWNWGLSAANERGNGTASAGLQAPAIFTGLANVSRIVSVFGDKWAKTSDGKWYRWGNNTTGALCTGNTAAISTPTEYTGISGIADVVGGAGCIAIVTNDGSMYVAGECADGGGSRTSPVLALTNVRGVYGHWKAMHALKKDGSWWSFGENSSGQLGLGNITNVLATSPVSNATLNSSTIKWVTGGAGATMFLTSSAAVRGAGVPDYYKGISGANVTSFETLAGTVADIATVFYQTESCTSLVTYSGKLYTLGFNSFSAASSGANPKPIGLITPPFTLAPLSRAPTWNTAAALSAFAVGAAVSVRLDATDARLYKVVSGTLPAGLALSVDGLLAGTPTAAAAHAWTVRAFGMTSGAFADRAFTSSFTASNVVLFMHMDGVIGGTSFTDSSLASRAITRSGGVTTSATQSKFGGTSAYFDGTGRLAVAPSSSFQFGTGDFTVEAFIYYANNVSQGTIYDHGNSNVAGSLSVFVAGTSLNVRMDGLNDLSATLPGSKFNTWTHIAVVRFSGILTMYVDGTSVASINRATANVSQNAPLVGATYYSNGGTYLYTTGYIDELRVSSDAKYTTNFTPPSGPFV
jgi:alpha-tubulin suppressor-like RCC1 family protein/predicted hotdog family 3-hydroxylacyl-ACP dehydratase